MGEHNRWSTFERELLLKLSKASETVGEVGQQQLKDSIDEVVYSNPTQPDSYERTYELRESAIYDKTVINDGVEIGIFNNVQMIHPYEPNKHMSITSGNDVSSSIPLWISQGTSGSHIYNHPERNYFKDARDKLKAGRVVKALRDGLKRQGLNS